MSDSLSKIVTSITASSVRDDVYSLMGDMRISINADLHIQKENGKGGHSCCGSIQKDVNTCFGR